MDKASIIRDVKCICGKTISDELMIAVNCKGHDKLQSISSMYPINKNNNKPISPLFTMYQNPERNMIAECIKCRQSKSKEFIRKMDCDHNYCIECLINMMRQSLATTKTKLICGCGESLNPYILQDINKGLYEKYNDMLAERFALGQVEDD